MITILCFIALCAGWTIFALQQDGESAALALIITVCVVVIVLFS